MRTNNHHIYCYSCHCLGHVTILIVIGDFKCIYNFIVAGNLIVDCILGADCMHYGVIIDCKECMVTMGGTKFSFPTPSTTVTSDADSTVDAVNLETIIIPGQAVQLIQVSVPVTRYWVSGISRMEW